MIKVIIIGAFALGLIAFNNAHQQSIASAVTAEGCTINNCVVAP